MGRIILETQIDAPIERVFDLARSIDLHTRSTTQTNERAVAGRTSGLIELGETVSWEAEHFGLTLGHTSEITKMSRPLHFRDQMLKGHFKTFVHDHFFEEKNGGTLMRDDLDLQSPYWFIGKLVDAVFMEEYFAKFLRSRNEIIKSHAESEEWKEFLTNA